MPLAETVRRGTALLGALVVLVGLVSVHVLVASGYGTATGSPEIVVEDNRTVLWTSPAAAPGERIEFDQAPGAPGELYGQVDLYVAHRGAHEQVIEGSRPSDPLLGRTNVQQAGGDRIEITAPGPADDRGFSPVEIVWVLQAREPPLAEDERERSLVAGWTEDAYRLHAEGTIAPGWSSAAERGLVAGEILALLAVLGCSLWLVWGLRKEEGREGAPASELESLARLADRGPAYLASLRNGLALSLALLGVAAWFGVAFWQEALGILFPAASSPLEEFVVWGLLGVLVLGAGVLSLLLAQVQAEISRWETARSRGPFEGG